MLKVVGIAFVFLIILSLCIRRFASRKKREGAKDLDDYVRQHVASTELKHKAMKEETARFGKHEALAPVEAGLREILDLHGQGHGIELTREDDALAARSGVDTITVVWDLRSTILVRKGKIRNIYGNGHWEVSINGGEQQPYAELETLMAHVSVLIRSMVRKEPLEQPSRLPDFAVRSEQAQPDDVPIQ